MIVLKTEDDEVFHFRAGKWIPVHNYPCQFHYLLVANCCQQNDEFLHGLTREQVDECRVVDESDGHI